MVFSSITLQGLLMCQTITNSIIFFVWIPIYFMKLSEKNPQTAIAKLHYSGATIHMEEKMSQTLIMADPNNFRWYSKW